MEYRPNDFLTLDQVEDRGRSVRLYSIGLLCALVITGLVLGGYAMLRKRHAQQVLATAKNEQPPAVQPKGPNRAQILVDEAMIKGDQTIVGGTVKNISNDALPGLSVQLELRRRKDGKTELVSVPVEPSQLKPQEEGR